MTPVQQLQIKKMSRSQRLRSIENETGCYFTKTIIFGIILFTLSKIGSGKLCCLK